jgi:hypothetical protein
MLKVWKGGGTGTARPWLRRGPPQALFTARSCGTERRLDALFNRVMFVNQMGWWVGKSSFSLNTTESRLKTRDASSPDGVNRRPASSAPRDSRALALDGRPCYTLCSKEDLCGRFRSRKVVSPRIQFQLPHGVGARESLCPFFRLPALRW